MVVVVVFLGLAVAVVDVTVLVVVDRGVLAGDAEVGEVGREVVGVAAAERVLAVAGELGIDEAGEAEVVNFDALAALVVVLDPRVRGADVGEASGREGVVAVVTVIDGLAGDAVILVEVAARDGDPDEELVGEEALEVRTLAVVALLAGESFVAVVALEVPAVDFADGEVDDVVVEGLDGLLTSGTV